MSTPLVLTKKQEKAQAFRAKQKQKKREGDVPSAGDVPELDLEPDQEIPEAVIVTEAATVGKGKAVKRKRDEVDEDVSATKVKPQVMEGMEKQRIKKGKGKNTAWEDDEVEGGDEAKAAKKSKKEVKQRFILFVGNLDYKTAREEVQNHFKEAVGHIPSVRLLTTKATPQKPSKSRGIAFLELPTSAELQQCLKLHHTIINGRTINVELTAGGGGKSEVRKGKIAGRNERVGGQRERKAEKEKEEAIASGTWVEPVVQTEPPKMRSWGGEAASAGAEVAADGSKVKIRGGRRVKVKQKDGEQGYPQSGGNSGRAARSSRPTQSHQGNARGGAHKWTPTGANAMVVG